MLSKSDGSRVRCLIPKQIYIQYSACHMMQVLWCVAQGKTDRKKGNNSSAHFKTFFPQHFWVAPKGSWCSWQPFARQTAESQLLTVTVYRDKLLCMYFCRKPTNATSFVLHCSHSIEWKNGGTWITNSAFMEQARDCLFARMTGDCFSPSVQSLLSVLWIEN